MTDRIILSIFAVLMLLLTIHRKEKYSILLTIGLTLAILITWTYRPVLILLGLFVFMISSLLVVFYGILKKGLSQREKTLIIMTGAWAFATNISDMLHLPSTHALEITFIFPLVLYIFMLGRGFIKKSEFGFLTILNAFFLLELLRFLR